MSDYAYYTNTNHRRLGEDYSGIRTATTPRSLVNPFLTPPPSVSLYPTSERSRDRRDIEKGKLKNPASGYGYTNHSGSSFYTGSSQTSASSNSSFSDFGSDYASTATFALSATGYPLTTSQVRAAKAYNDRGSAASSTSSQTFTEHRQRDYPIAPSATTVTRRSKKNAGPYSSSQGRSASSSTPTLNLFQNSPSNVSSMSPYDSSGSASVVVTSQGILIPAGYGSVTVISPEGRRIDIIGSQVQGVDVRSTVPTDYYCQSPAMRSQFSLAPSDAISSRSKSSSRAASQGHGPPSLLAGSEVHSSYSSSHHLLAQQHSEAPLGALPQRYDGTGVETRPKKRGVLRKLFHGTSSKNSGRELSRSDSF